jgi:catalase
MRDDAAIPATTTDASIGAPSDEFSLSAGAEGPLLLQDHYLIQKMAHFNRERVPEHVVHAKGHGPFGFFEAWSWPVSSLPTFDRVDSQRSR